MSSSPETSEAERAARIWKVPLTRWFADHGRQLPWRETEDPYAIWVSEIMLQQTQVATVLGYYDAFLARFPTVEALADAPLEAVLKAWEGLGYYRRASLLHRGARYVATQFGGTLPSDPKALGSVPGIGPYTAGAILAFAFGKRAAAVDGNVLRVLARLTGTPWQAGRAKDQRAAREWLYAAVTEGDSAAVNEGLIELGALICTKRPDCGRCPLRDTCVARQTGQTEVLPLPATRTRQTEEHWAFLILRHVEGGFYVMRRPETGLLAGLWQFPALPGPLDEEAVTLRLEAAGLHLVKPPVHRLDRKHIFSHKIWQMAIFEATVDGPDRLEVPETTDTASAIWQRVTRDRLEALPFSSALADIRDRLVS